MHLVNHVCIAVCECTLQQLSRSHQLSSPLPFLTMASMLDCESVFFARMENMDLGKFIDRLKGFGWTTMANFAFSVEFQPGQGLSKEHLHNVVFKSYSPTSKRGTATRRSSQ